MMFYTDPSREHDPHALPDAEVWGVRIFENGQVIRTEWFWWACFPGCLPDGDPTGPFCSMREAVEDARDGVADPNE